MRPGVALLLAALALGCAATPAALPPPSPERPLGAALGLPSLPERPGAHDLAAGSLRAYQDALLQAFGGDPRDVPLAIKSDHFEWMIWRYHFTPYQQVAPRVILPDRAGEPIRYRYGSDVSTWNGALLAALAYKYAVTRDPGTLERIAELLEGLHLFLEVTGVSGLPARCVLEADAPVDKATLPYVGPDGRRYVYRAEPAKGTLNQLILGYATLLMLAGDELPDPANKRAHHDMNSMALHLLRNGYRLVDARGQQTRYGDLRPRVWGIPMPFNAQVSYMVVAAAHAFQPEDPVQRERVEREMRWFRTRRPYYRSWWWPPFFTPQRVATSRFLGANDFNHLTNAAFMGVALELYESERQGRPPDPTLVRELGRTLYWSAERLRGLRNSLCNFMWLALLADPRFTSAADYARDESTRRQAGPLLDVGIEQLRRFPLDRLRKVGNQVRSDHVQWVDAYRPDSYHWKVEPRLTWEVTGHPTDLLTSAIDFLHAYWLFRYHGLDRHWSVSPAHLPVL